MPQDFPKRITAETQVKFEISKSGLYAITVTARCKRKDDLRVEIDNQFFREIPPEKNIQKYNVPPAWNGSMLKGRSQTNIFIIWLEKGEHILVFIPRERAQVESFDFWQVLDTTNIEVNLEKQAENGNGRPWITIALINFPLKSIIAEASVDWHLFDGDDVKLIVDNEIEKNADSRLWRNWLWHATPQQIISSSKREQKTVVKDLDRGNHYLEFWADQTPTLHKVILDLGELDSEEPSANIDQPPPRIPTVDDPRWTGDFADDTDQMILARVLFGEARNTLVPDEARIAIGWVIKNRVESSRWSNTYWEVITTPSQFSSINVGDDNRPFVEDPLHKNNEVDKKAWKHTYDIARKIIKGEIADPTQGANHYYDDSISSPDWAKDQKPTLTISYINQYEVEVRIFFLSL
ncbi:cell wall hydrolase [Patescibacteria group bacterium]|nr:cell wall hydrolase [Patescibacteria group bacterium]MBU1886019.1 cell wall hydrolase [Patescibacteria group bacterium]